MVVFHGGQIFVFEFKMIENKTKTAEALDSAIARIRERDYAGKYCDRGQPIYLVGMVFGREERNLLEVRAERI